MSHIDIELVCDPPQVPARSNVKTVVERHYFNVGSKEDPKIKSKKYIRKVFIKKSIEL